MNLQDIAAELERLRELTNESGKQIVDRIQKELKQFEVPLVVEKEVLAPGDRRTEVRDPGEKEQTLAKKLKLVKK